MKLDGTDLRLDIYTVWSRLVQALPGVAREAPNAISRSLYKIELRGTLGGHLDGRPEFVPFLVEPAKRLMERLGSMGN
jgi:hypothetical protein